MKITPKRTTKKEKIIYAIKPYIIYMFVKTFAMLIIAVALPMLPFEGMEDFIQNNSNMLSAISNAIASIIAVASLLEDFIKTVSVSGEIDIDAKILKRLWAFVQNDMFKTKFENKRTSAISLALMFVLGGGLGLGLNKLFEIITRVIDKDVMLGSEKYAQVEAIQYSVSLWVGLILYVIVSPIVEEIVFRGIVYNRMRYFFGVWKAVIVSAVLFGAFHGNLPQCLYGMIMGIIMAVAYEYIGSFAAPLLFHMGANAVVYIVSVLK